MTHEERDPLAQAFDQLEALHQSGADPGSVQDPETAANLEMLAILESLESAEPAMPAPVEFRKGVLSKIKRRRKLAWEGVFAIAAAFLIGAFVFFPEKDAVTQPGLMMDQDLLSASIDNQTRQAMVNYLESSERLLLAIRDHEVACSENQADIAPEKELAKQLLMRQKLFSPQMSDPNYYQAKQLFSQLERILVDVNTMDPCTDPFEMELINEHINTNRILSKLRLVTQNIQLS